MMNGGTLRGVAIAPRIDIAISIAGRYFSTDSFNDLTRANMFLRVISSAGISMHIQTVVSGFEETP
jgi:hypothetical protein